MRSRMIQVGSAAALLLGGTMLAAVFSAAQAPAVQSALKFTATTENVGSTHDSIEINLTRFSNDAESSQVAAAWTQYLAGVAAAAGRSASTAPKLAGGKVEVVTPGNSKQSLLAKRISDTTGNQMPPRGPLAKDDIAAITAWIDGGAKDADFGTVEPILNANCVSCHGGANARAGLSLESLEDLRDGGNDPTAGRGRPQTPEGTLASAMEKAPTLGYVWSSQSFGDAIRYAVKVPQSDGSEHVILVVDRLDAGSDSWKGGPGALTKGTATEDTATPNSEFSVIELRLNSQGHGEGKISTSDKAAVDSTGKTIALGNYNELPVVLTNVTQGTLNKY
jgi:hypothetical protein